MTIYEKTTSTRIDSNMGPTSFRLNTSASIREFVVSWSLSSRKLIVRVSPTAAIEFGTWQDEEAQAKAVETALAAGCRHIDTASMYGTEEAVARGIRVSVVRREDIFLVTKLWNHKHKPSDVEPALDASLKALGTDYVDLWLM
jgi:diketogulonate reductase-like aldo/keto reductase